MMTDAEALDSLRKQGHSTGTPDAHTGRVRVWIRGNEEALDVQLGKELHELAEGKLSFEEIQAWREDEAAARQE